MWQLGDVFRGDWGTRQGWGWHDTGSCQVYLDTVKQIAQLTKDVKVEDVIFNDFVAGANAFDKEQVKADAMGYQLSPEFEAVPVPEGAGT